MIEFLRDLLAWTLEAPTFPPDVVPWDADGLHVNAGPVLDEWGSAGASRVHTGFLSVYRCAGL
jgi:hypothetical protein